MMILKLFFYIYDNWRDNQAFWYLSTGSLGTYVIIM